MGLPPNNCAPLRDRLIVQLQAIERTRKKVEALLQSKDVCVRDMNAIYAGLFTNAIIVLESFIENLFVGLLAGSCNQPGCLPRAKFSTRPTAMAFVLGGKEYVEWLPYERTKKRADLFFKMGHPFSLLPTNLEEKIKKSTLIRNALVHTSRFAREQFEEKVMGDTPLAPRERTPIGFLRSQLRIDPVQHRFEIYTLAFSETARILSGLGRKEPTLVLPPEN